MEEDSSTPLLQEESRSDAAAAAAAAKRESGDEGAGGGLAGDPAAIESIQNLLLMVPVDLEKLRNLAWDKGGYQVRFWCERSECRSKVISARVYEFYTRQEAEYASGSLYTCSSFCRLHCTHPVFYEGRRQCVSRFV